jgi:hypothetical protein
VIPGEAACEGCEVIGSRCPLVNWCEIPGSTEGYAIVADTKPSRSHIRLFHGADETSDSSRHITRSRMSLQFNCIRSQYWAGVPNPHEKTRRWPPEYIGIRIRPSSQA